MARTILVLLPCYLALLLVQDGLVFLFSENARDVGSGASPQDVLGLFDGTFWGLMVTGILSLGIFVTLAIVFGIWLARAHGNAEALTGSKLPKGMAWTVGAWYIPIVGGFLAVGPIRDLWRRGPGGPVGKPIAWAVLFSVAYLVNIAGSIAAFIISFGAALETVGSGDRFTAGTGTHPVSLAAGLAFTLVLTVSGICMWLSVQAIQRWQENAAGRAGSPFPSAAPTTAPWR